MSTRQSDFNVISAALFAISASIGLFASRIKREKATSEDSHQSPVSARGLKTLSPPIPYLSKFLTCLENPYDANKNKKGYIAMCVAENKLVLDMLAERFMQVGTATAAFSDSDVYCYNSFLGMPVARQAAAYFLARRFLYDRDTELRPEEALRAVQPKHVGLGAGAAPLLNALFFALGNASDACLIPAPYYAAFENDMNVVAGIVPIAVKQGNAFAGPTNEELEIAYCAALKKGHTPRFVLLSNPNNPLGTIYRAEVLHRIVLWARNKNMHTIVDEIYALSAHQSKHNFQSIIRVLNNNLGNDVHMVWAFSKDFGASGIRAGIVYSQNETFMEALSTLNIFSCVSGPIQYMVAELLTDDAFVTDFLDEARERIVHSYRICTSKLDEMVLPYVPAEAGLFVYVDFSSLLPEQTIDWEETLSDLIFEHARIVLTPGSNQRDPKPGMFRICYTWVSPEVLSTAMERLSKLVSKLRRLDWGDLSDRNSIGIL